MRIIEGRKNIISINFSDVDQIQISARNGVLKTKNLSLALRSILDDIINVVKEFSERGKELGITDGNDCSCFVDQIHDNLTNLKLESELKALDKQELFVRRCHNAISKLTSGESGLKTYTIPNAELEEIRKLSDSINELVTRGQSLVKQQIKWRDTLSQVYNLEAQSSKGFIEQSDCLVQEFRKLPRDFKLIISDNQKQHLHGNLGELDIFRSKIAEWDTYNVSFHTYVQQLQLIINSADADNEHHVKAKEYYQTLLERVQVRQDIFKEEYQNITEHKRTLAKHYQSQSTTLRGEAKRCTLSAARQAYAHAAQLNDVQAQNNWAVSYTKGKAKNMQQAHYFFRCAYINESAKDKPNKAHLKTIKINLRDSYVAYQKQKKKGHYRIQPELNGVELFKVLRAVSKEQDDTKRIAAIANMYKELSGLSNIKKTKMEKFTRKAQL